tara:strand:- start:5686 stop:5949 length:264 start_codon:yes stop_codon:yes gene_type:complete
MKKLLLFLIPAALISACTETKKAEQNEVSENEWVVLFDGTSTDSLRGYGIDVFPEGVWLVEKGMLVTNPDTANRDLLTKGRYKNFEL